MSGMTDILYLIKFDLALLTIASTSTLINLKSCELKQSLMDHAYLKHTDKKSVKNEKRKTVSSRALFKIRKWLFFIRHSFLRSRSSRKVKVIKSHQDITTDIRMHACPHSVRIMKYCNIAILLIIKRHPNHQSYSRPFLLFFFS